MADRGCPQYLDSNVNADRPLANRFIFTEHGQRATQEFAIQKAKVCCVFTPAQLAFAYHTALHFPHHSTHR